MNSIFLFSEDIKKILNKYEQMYDSFDNGHNRHHMEVVRQRAIELAEKYLKEDIPLAYITATLHDVGLSKNRENHEIVGKEIIHCDLELHNILGDKLAIVADAIGEHRASNGNPMTILGKIISDADRGGANIKEAILRPCEYVKANYSNLSEDEILKMAGDHIIQKFSKGAYGRRCYFAETKERLEKLYQPIIEAYTEEGIAGLKKLRKDYKS